MYTLEMHEYQKDEQSGAGNCSFCAHPLECEWHPHTFRASLVDNKRCLCGLKRFDYVHYE